MISVEEIIADLLGKVLEKYPQNRTSEIKERTENIWYGDPQRDRLTYAYMGGGVPAGYTDYLANLPEGTGLLERDLVEQLQNIYNHKDWQDVFFPALSPGCRQITIPSYFGCIEETASDSSRVKPIIKNPADVYHIPEIGFIPGTEGGDMLLKMKYFKQRTKGLLWVYETDMQGPFSVASQIWGVEDFLAALYDHPDEVHHLVKKCTEVIIKFYKLMFAAVEGTLIPLHCMPAVWFPQSKGVALSEDLLAVVSPAVVRKFIKPYLEMISAEFGGVVVHSCGSINHVAKELNAVKGLMGINFSSSETDLVELDKSADRRLVFLCHNSPVNRGDLHLLNPVEHLELCRKVFAAGRNLISFVFPLNANPDPLQDGKIWEAAATLSKNLV